MTEPYYDRYGVTVHHGDCLGVLATLPDSSVHAVVTDPPYGLEFMGKGWDSFRPSAARLRTRVDDRTNPVDGKSVTTNPEAYVAGLPFHAWCEGWLRECLRVLKPGGHLLAFGGSRTWHRLAAAVEDAGFENRDSIAWLYASGFPKSLDVSKAIDKAAGAVREVVGPPTRHGGGTNGVYAQDAWTLANQATMGAVTAPATDAARAWQGWGTALKPAFEPIVVARKPLAGTGINVRLTIEASLRAQGVEEDIRWTNEPANGAAQPDQPASSSSTGRPPAEATSASPAGVPATPNGEKPTGSSSAMPPQRGEPPTASMSAPTLAGAPPSCERKCSGPTATPAPAAESEQPSSSPSTTSTEAEPPTDGRPGARSTSRSNGRVSPPATESFAGIATGLTGSRATVRINRRADGVFVWPDGLSAYVSGGPNTVAANVLEHGVGALNIDGCRIGTTVETWPSSRGPNTGDSMAGGAMITRATGTPPPGRWPTNVVLTHAATAHGVDLCVDECVPGCPVAELGEASRFFPVFRFEAKAPTAERPRVDGVAHPTVKPLALMRWLVRLVTPPAGTVLDPFLGSGTTAQAARAEGFRCIGVEREESYLPLIRSRLDGDGDDLFGGDAA